MPAITPPDLRNVRNISTPTETYRKVSMPTVYCKSRCNVSPDIVDRSWTPQRYTVIGTTSISYDYKALGEDKVLTDNFIAHYAGGNNGNPEYMDGALFPRMDDMPVRIGAVYNQDLSRWCEVVSPDHIRFGYGEGLDVGGDVEVDPDKSFDIRAFGSDFKEPRQIWSVLPEYIIIPMNLYVQFVAKPPFELDAKQVVPDKKKDRWVIARLVVDYEEITIPGTSTWVPPTDNTFLTTQTGAAYTPPTNQHICYISDPNSPYYGRYYSKNSGAGYTEHTTHVPWLWRNNEPFYFKNISNDTISVSWRSRDTYTGVVWANILVDSNGVATSKQISNNVPLVDTDIPSGYKLYIFRIDTGTGNHGGARSYDPSLIFNDGGGNYYYSGGGIWRTSVPIILSDTYTYWNTHPENMISINPGDWDAVWLRGEGTDKSDIVYSPFNTGWVSSSIEIGGNLHTLFFCNIQGSINGLSYLNGVSYLNALWGNPQYYWWTKQYEGAFISSSLFAGLTTIADASKLEFPHKTLPVCYHDMFLGCTNMVHGPAELPALQQYIAAYAEMFYRCSNLLESPIIYSNFMNYIQKSLVGFTGDDYIHMTKPGFCSVNGVEYTDSDYYIYVSDGCHHRSKISFAFCENLQEIRSKACGHFDMSTGDIPSISHGGSIGLDAFTGGIDMGHTGISGNGTVAYIRPYKWSVWYVDRQNSIDPNRIRQNWGGYGNLDSGEVASFEDIDTALSGKYSN